LSAISWPILIKSIARRFNFWSFCIMKLIVLKIRDGNNLKMCLQLFGQIYIKSYANLGTKIPVPSCKKKPKKRQWSAFSLFFITYVLSHYLKCLLVFNWNHLIVWNWHMTKYDKIILIIILWYFYCTHCFLFCVVFQIKYPTSLLVCHLQYWSII
jgi:hypothetical protein